jgi:predicted nucleic acid-binding protein
MILDVVQWLLDVTGKLGPLAVAIAVFLTGKRQSRWMNHAAARSASIEDQKLRLALLDRRLKVLDHLREARATLVKPNSSDALGAVLDALREAELIFEDNEQSQLRECLDIVTRYMSRYGLRFIDLTGEELAEAVKQYTACSFRIVQVQEQLRIATRVKDIPALVPPN